MKAVVGCAAIVFALATASAANAKGCLKGAAVGGVAGHYASHHGILGAVAGCVIGRHEANKRALMQSDQINRPYRDIRDDERRLKRWANPSA